MPEETTTAEAAAPRAVKASELLDLGERLQSMTNLMSNTGRGRVRRIRETIGQLVPELCRIEASDDDDLF